MFSLGTSQLNSSATTVRDCILIRVESILQSGFGGWLTCKFIVGERGQIYLGEGEWQLGLEVGNSKKALTQERMELGRIHAGVGGIV